MPLRKTKKTADEVTRKAYKFLALPDDKQKLMFHRLSAVSDICITEC